MYNNTSFSFNVEHHGMESVKFEPRSEIVPLVLAFIIVLINGYIFWLIAKNKKLHRSITNKWLASLAGCDLFMGFVGVSLYVSCNSTWNTPTCFTSAVVITFISIATLLHILAITVDRYIYILYPLRYNELVTRWRTHVAMILLWSVSLSAAVVQLTWTNFDIDVTEDGEKQEEKINRIYYMSCTVIFFVVPLLFMIYAYARVLFEVRKQCNRMNRNNILRRSDIRSENFRERRAIIMYIIILSLYLVGWMPYFLLILQQSLGMKLTFKMSHDLEYFFFVLRISSSFLRPILYTMGKHDLRNAAKTKLKALTNYFRKQENEQTNNFRLTPSDVRGN